jgi:hypothetical protein
MKKSLLLPIAMVLALSASAQKFDPTNMIVVGEGLAAGVADFSLKDIYQKKNFGARLAEQMNVSFPQPLMQGVGVGNVPGFPEMPVRTPGPGQGAVRADFPPQLFIFNLSVPGYKLTDTFGRRPSTPLIRTNDMTQTLANFTLGYPALLLKDKPLWTQVEYAQQMNPTLAFVELGFAEILEAAAAGDLSKLPDVNTFKTNYTNLLNILRNNGGTTVVAMTVPDPSDTAYYTNLVNAQRLVQAPPSVLQNLYKLNATDLLTVAGVTEIAAQIDARQATTLPAGSVVTAATAAQISTAVNNLNSAITSAAQASGAIVYDLKGLFSRVKANGVFVGNNFLSSQYFGGFYSLNGYYPGATGHALIANEILAQFNASFGTSYPPVNLIDVANRDATIRQATQTGGTIQ